MMKPAGLEQYFSAWEAKWHDTAGKDINNPKIPVKFVVENGRLLFGQTPPKEEVEPDLEATVADAVVKAPRGRKPRVKVRS